MTWLIDNLIINLIELFNDAKLSTCIKIHDHFTKVGTMVNIQIYRTSNMVFGFAKEQV